MKISSVKFGKILREWRKKKKLKQVDMCDIIGVTQGSYSELENGLALPSAGTIAAMGKYIPAFHVLKKLIECEKKK